MPCQTRLVCVRMERMGGLTIITVHYILTHLEISRLNDISGLVDASIMWRVPLSRHDF